MTDDLPLLGFGLPIAGRWATPETLGHVAQRAETLGYASLWTYQRLLTPVDGSLGPGHDAVLDPVAALGFVAARTERIRIGTATICAPYVPPAVLAKAMTSLDVLSGGRLDVGVGMGWLPEEHTAAGLAFERRGARFDEYLRCLRALWTEDPVEFAGEFYNVPRSHQAPRPVQRPHPPLLVGGTAEPALRRAGRLADGWIGSSRHDPAQIGASVVLVREGARDAGRDPDSLRIVVRGIVELTDRDPGRDRRPLHGTRDQVLADLAALRATGATEVFADLNLSPRPAGPEADAADALAAAERVLGALAPSDA